MAYDQVGRYAEAEALYRRVLAFSVRTRGARADLSQATLGNLATALVQLGRAKEAIALARQVFEVQRGRTGADSADTLWAESNLADDTALSGDLAGAETLFADAVARGRHVFSHGEWDLGAFTLHLGRVLAQEGKDGQARAALTDSVAILQARLGAGDARTMRAKLALAAIK
jgi:tetratricopeptide (TPR) repeat protein